MPDKVGKYEVLERIGRGGMGTIFKARDPVLHRLVAIKVISSEVDITAELRARFFREAQACARLSHPNIVTVYDMGEDEDRLFIVMELLEGEELRRYIAQKRALPLEDKLAIIAQVCDGVHYAHQHGIVHRDIKPGNIMVLPTGRVKILDFGIAQIANTEGGLTRTGLIMGTLRYISPEQARGFTDHRSDIYSVGAVCYEFLAGRPPFTGDDPIHLLEQLRTMDPPSLTEVDAAIPEALSTIVERAMRKDPGQRFADLEQMRNELEEVERGLAEEAQVVSARVRAQRDQLRALEVTLAERTGSAVDGKSMPAATGRARLSTLLALERDLAGRIEEVRAQITRADALAPALERAFGLLAADQTADALAEFESIVRALPDHARALDGLARARARIDEDRRRQLAAQLLRDARMAFRDQAYALCLERLEQASAIPPLAEDAALVASLRQRAEAALTAEEAAVQMKQNAEQGRERMAQARARALPFATTPYAPDLWRDAEAWADQAQAALARAAYADAREAFGAAETAFVQFGEAAREAQARDQDALERARDAMARARASALAGGARQHASDFWAAAEARAAEAERARATLPAAQAVRSFADAQALFLEAETLAASSRQRDEGEEARNRAAEARRRAEAAGAPEYVSGVWLDGASKFVDAEASQARGEHARAAEAFAVAQALYRRAEGQAHEERRRLQEESDRVREEMAECKRRASAADPRASLALWNEADEHSASGEAALGRAAYREATQAFDRSATIYRQIERLAQEAARTLEAERRDAETARKATGFARHAAVESQAARYAPEQWRVAEAAAAQAHAALDRREPGVARTAFTEARRMYQAAAQAAGLAQDAEARRVDAMVADARRSFASGDLQACLRRLGEVLALRPDHQAAGALRSQAERRVFDIDALDRAEVGAHRDAVAIPPVQGVGESSRPLSGDGVLTSVMAPAEASRDDVTETTVLAEVPPAIGEGRSAMLPRVEARASDETKALSFPRAGRDPMAVPDTLQPRPVPRWKVSLGARPTALAAAAILAVIVLALGYLLWPAAGPPPLLEELRKNVAAAREDARRAGAERSEQFARAADKEREGEAARQQKDFKTAQERYGQALTGFRTANAEVTQSRADALSAQDRAGKARRAAETAGAPDRAGSLWAKAETAWRDAEAALQRGAFTRAQTLYGDAERVYRDAQEGAVSRLNDDVQQLRKTVAAARKEAERADARRLAANAFAAAQQQQDQAEVAATNRDPASAKLFQDAQRLFKQAVTDATAQRVAVERSEATKAQERAASARRRAEQAGASQFATGLFAWAENKQRDAASAVKQSEYDRAAQLYGGAQADYDIAAEEAKRKVEPVSGRTSAEQAQRRVAIYRESAAKVGADRLARDLFGRARAKEAGADELMKKQSFSVASQTYGEAGDLYFDAARHSSYRVDADSVQLRMRAEKDRADPKSPDYKAALTEEEYGKAAYERLAYREAADRFRTAQALYASAGARAVAGPAESEPRRSR